MPNKNNTKKNNKKNAKKNAKKNNTKNNKRVNYTNPMCGHCDKCGLGGNIVASTSTGSNVLCRCAGGHTWPL